MKTGGIFSLGAVRNWFLLCSDLPETWLVGVGVDGGVCYRCFHICRTLFLFDVSEVEVEVNLRPTLSRPVCLGVRRQSGTCDQFFFLLEISFRQLRVCYFVAPSLTRGRVCNLLVQLLLGLARAVTLGPKSSRTHDHILLSHLRLPQPGGPSPRIYILQEQGVTVIPPGTGFPFCHLLRLAGQRWRYSNPPPHRVTI
jgi:hypothetical protein